MPQPHLFCQVCAPSCTLCALWYLAPSEAWGLASGVTESPPYPAPINPLSRTEHGSTKTSGWDQLFDATDTAEPLGDPAEDPLVGKAPYRLSPSPSLSRLIHPLAGFSWSHFLKLSPATQWDCSGEIQRQGPPTWPPRSFLAFFPNGPTRLPEVTEDSGPRMLGFVDR